MTTKMDTKICDICGNRVDQAAGKTCQLGHFICGSCVTSGALPAPRKYCTLCHTLLG